MARAITLIVLLAAMAAPLAAQSPPSGGVQIPDPSVQASIGPGGGAVGFSPAGPMVAPPAVAAENGAPTPAESLGERIARLEAANQRMLAELQSLREQPPAPPPVQAAAGMATPLESGVPAATAAPVDLAAPGAAPETAGPDDICSLIQGEVGRLMWGKGDFRIVPYGYLWANTVYATEKTYPGTYTLWVDSATTRGESEFVVDGRNTRLGIDVSGPQIPWFGGAQTGGKVEFDFQGAFDATENKGAVLLRHAYVEVKNDEFRFLAGQTWDVISPLMPSMLLYSVGWEAGNIGYRRAQVRLERYLAVSDNTLLTLQGSINQNVFGDEISVTTGGTTYALQPDPSGWPIIEGRGAVTLGQRTGPDALPITLGFSAHGGQTGFGLMNGSTPDPAYPKNQLRNTWSVNADWYVPISQRFGVQGEFFTGENLSPFLGGIGQGLDAAVPGEAGVTGVVTEPLGEIRDTGGWCELWYNLTPRLHTHFGYSVDSPDRNDLHVAGERSYNQFFYTNFIYDVTKQFLMGVEISAWKTLYVSTPTSNFLPGESVRCEFVAKYGF